MMHAQQAVTDYLEAIRRTHGDEYRSHMTVAADDAGHVLVKHPDAIEGEVVPLGHLELMTEHLLSELRH